MAFVHAGSGNGGRSDASVGRDCRFFTFFLVLLTASLGVSAADFQKGVEAYRHGDYALALQEWEPLARAGNAAAQNNLGIMYEHGQGVAPDYARAASLYQQSADAGNVEADANLAWMYRQGHGVAQDYARAAQFYLLAANAGDKDAQYMLGLLYKEGKGVAQDNAMALAWWRSAADKGNVEAANDLGVAYYRGEGVAKDYALAMSWYRKASDGGSAAGACNLGLMYKNGESVAVDLARAASYLQKAADKGNAQAQDQLGLMYAYGRGEPLDLAQAEAWFAKAVAQGNGDASRHLQTLHQRQADAASGQGPSDTAQGSGDTTRMYLRLGADGLKIFAGLAALWVIFRKRKSNGLADASEIEPLPPAPAPGEAAHALTAAPAEDFAVWNRAFVMQAAAMTGVLSGLVLMIFPDLLPRHGHVADGGDLFLLAVTGLTVLMTVAVLVTVVRNASSPALRLDAMGVTVRGRRQRIEWRHIQSISVVQGKGKNQAPLPGVYKMTINFLSWPPATSRQAPGSSCRVGLNHPSVSVWLVLAIMRARVGKALGQGPSAIPLPMGSAGIGNAALSLVQDPRLPVRSPWRRFINGVADCWLAIALALFVAGAIPALDSNWYAFRLNPVIAPQLLGLGCLAGLLLYLACRPQIIQAGVREGSDSTVPGAAPGWRDLLWLPVFVGLLGYIPVGTTIPQLANALVGTPYTTHFAVTGKHHEPAQGRSSECYAVTARAQDGSAQGRFCLASAEFPAVVSGAGGSTLSVSGLRSWWGSQLNRFTLDAAAPRTPVVAVPDVAAAPPATSAPAPELTPAVPESAEMQKAMQTRCLALKEDYARLQTLKAHMEMAQACADAHVRYE